MKKLHILLFVASLLLIMQACDTNSEEVSIDQPDQETEITAPHSVEASDGDYTDRVIIKWEGEKDRYFQVYRSNSRSTNGASISNWQKDLGFIDKTAKEGQSYYYKVKAATSSNGSNASDFSTSDEGSLKAEKPLAAPTGVAASDGTYNNKIRVSWNSKSGQYYKVYRSKSRSSNGSAITDWQTGSRYTDYDIVPDDYYYYRVKAAENSSGKNASPLSSYNRGYAEEEEEAEAPDDVEASDGDYSDKVRITWDGDSSDDYFKVYRSTSRSRLGSALNDWSTREYFNDYEATPGKKYYYRVKAAKSRSGDGVSEESEYDSGYRAEEEEEEESCVTNRKYRGSVVIETSHARYNGNQCEVIVSDSGIRIHTPRTLRNGRYSPSPSRGDISLIDTYYWREVDDFEWELNSSSFSAASIYLPVNNLGDQALNIASGAEMELQCSGSSRKIIIKGSITSPYRTNVEVRITF